MQGGEKYKNKYRIESSRLQGYDYSQNGLYFVTICTQDKWEFFGEIKNAEMVLNEMGKIVQTELLQTPIIRKNIFLDEWVIMPNHLHVIFEICNVFSPDNNTSKSDNMTIMGCGGHKKQWKSGCLGAVINQIKGRCTKIIQKSINQNFAWQPRFYDVIIRNEQSLYKIREYIVNNPAKWEMDRNNQNDLWM